MDIQPLTSAQQALRLGRAYAAQGQFTAAIEQLKLVLDPLLSEGRRDDVGQCVRALGQCESALGRYEEASTYLEWAVLIDQELGLQASELVDALANGEALSAGGQTARALRAYEQALDLAQTIGERELRARLHWRIGAALVQAHRIEQAVDAYTTGLAVMGDLRDGEWGAASCDLGDVMARANRWDEALGAYRAGLVAARERQDDGLELRCLLGEGHALIRLKRDEEALVALGRARELCERLADFASEFTCLMDLGQADAHLGRHDAAVQAFRMAHSLPAEVIPHATRTRLIPFMIGAAANAMQAILKGGPR